MGEQTTHGRGAGRELRRWGQRRSRSARSAPTSPAPSSQRQVTTGAEQQRRQASGGARRRRRRRELGQDQRRQVDGRTSTASAHGSQTASAASPARTQSWGLDPPRAAGEEEREDVGFVAPEALVIRRTEIANEPATDREQERSRADAACGDHRPSPSPTNASTSARVRETASSKRTSSRPAAVVAIRDRGDPCAHFIPIGSSPSGAAGERLEIDRGGRPRDRGELPARSARAAGDPVTTLELEVARRLVRRRGAGDRRPRASATGRPPRRGPRDGLFPEDFSDAGARPRCSVRPKGRQRERRRPRGARTRSRRGPCRQRRRGEVAARCRDARDRLVQAQRQDRPGRLSSTSPWTSRPRRRRASLRSPPAAALIPSRSSAEPSRSRARTRSSWSSQAGAVLGRPADCSR